MKMDFTKTIQNNLKHSCGNMSMYVKTFRFGGEDILYYFCKTCKVYYRKSSQQGLDKFLENE